MDGRYTEDKKRIDDEEIISRCVNKLLLGRRFQLIENRRYKLTSFGEAV